MPFCQNDSPEQYLKKPFPEKSNKTLKKLKKIIDPLFL